MKRIDAPQHPDAARHGQLTAELARDKSKPRTNAERDALIDMLLAAHLAAASPPS